MNLFFQFCFFSRAQLCLLIHMHASFINSTIRQCPLVPSTGDTGCSHRTYKPRVEWTSHPSLDWELLGDRNWICKGLGQGLAPKGTQKLVKLKLNASDSEKTEFEFKKRLNVNRARRPGLPRRALWFWNLARKPETSTVPWWTGPVAWGPHCPPLGWTWKFDAGSSECDTHVPARSVLFFLLWDHRGKQVVSKAQKWVTSQRSSWSD